MNLKFQDFYLNYERSVFREFLKLKTFASAGSYKKHLELMNSDGEGESEANEEVTSQVKDESSNLQVVQTSPVQEDQDEFRINLIFYKIEIRKQSVDWNKDKIEQTSKLRIASDTQYISLSMKKDQFTCIVLLKELDFEDLDQAKFKYFRDIVTYSN